jgi:hypothetical protein
LFVAIFISRFQAWALDRDLSRASQNNDYGGARYALERAKEGNVHLDKTLVRKSTAQFIDSNDHKAWNAVLASIDYKSMLNTNVVFSQLNYDFKPGIENKCSFTPSLNIEVPQSEGMGEASKSINVLFAGTAGAGNAARLEQIDKPTSAGCGAEFAVLQIRPDNYLMLDNLYIKNVIIKDTRVSYSASRPVRLDNVYFMNCTFDFPDMPQARALASAILANSSVTFSQE